MSSVSRFFLFLSFRWNHSFMLIVASLLSQRERRATVSIAAPRCGTMHIDVIYILTTGTSRSWIIDGFIQGLLMVPGGQVPPCSERRRIDSRSEMADNSLAERSRMRQREKGRAREGPVFSLRRGDV